MALRRAPSKKKKSSKTPNRRRFESVGAQLAAKCSFEKVPGDPNTNRSTPTQPKFVHKDKTPSVLKAVESKKQQVFREWFENVCKGGLRDIRKEFVNDIKKYRPEGTTDAFNHPDNASKNRYDDIYLLDKTRVKVRINPENDDYIHASFVEVHPGLTYICAQGPLQNTIEQFWLMCIQEEVKVVLQLCKNVENGSEKCSDYLPKSSSWMTFGQVRVKVVKESAPVPGTKKVFRTVVTCEFEDKETNITHVQYSGWPDHAVPEHVASCREVRVFVRKLSEHKPIVVHCSAGIGRTGSFVAIEMVCHKVLTELKPVFSMGDLMRELRNQRTLAVQNDQQYSFIFRCVLDILLAEEDGLVKTDEVTAFIDSYENMLMRKKKKPRVGKSVKKHAKTAVEE